MLEADFQKEILKNLKISLGEEIQEHARQAGGFIDIKYRSVIIELKVERNDGNRDYICRKYKEQGNTVSGSGGKASGNTTCA